MRRVEKLVVVNETIIDRHPKLRSLPCWLNWEEGKNGDLGKAGEAGHEIDKDERR